MSLPNACIFHSVTESDSWQAISTVHYDNASLKSGFKLVNFTLNTCCMESHSELFLLVVGIYFA